MVVTCKYSEWFMGYISESTQTTGLLFGGYDTGG